MIYEALSDGHAGMLPRLTGVVLSLSQVLISRARYMYIGEGRL